MRVNKLFFHSVIKNALKGGSKEDCYKLYKKNLKKAKKKGLL